MLRFLLSAFVLVPFVFSDTSHAAEKTKPVASLSKIQDLLTSKQAISAEQYEGIAQFFLKKYKKQKIDFTKGQTRCVLQRIKDGSGYAGWFFKAPAGKKVIIQAEKQRQWTMHCLGNTGYYAWVEKFPNFSGVHWRIVVDGRRLGIGRGNRFGFESYTLGADSKKQQGVPEGKIIPMSKHISKIVYPGAERTWWVYVPAQYKEDGPPLKLMVFNDGQGFCHRDGNACIVMDNLIHAGKIPPMFGLFVQPGEITRSKGQQVRNRSNEYDTCTPQFATFLEKEIFPIIYKKYNISKKPEDHGILGSSSGGSCAFTAAWHRPDLFRRVVSFVGSFDDFRPVGDYPSFADKKNNLPLDQFGPWKTAHDYPGLIRKTDPRKPIKVFLQDGDNDLDNKLGNWFLNNQRMAAALAFSGYDYKFVAGHGVHSSRHGKAIMPECLTWIWSDAK